MQDILSGYIWTIVGVFGQILFFIRFFVQWLASERAGKSVIPIAFWYFSIIGGLTLFAYALWRKDPVFILGQSIGIVIYSRNLYLIRKEANLAKERYKTDVYVSRD